MRCSFGNAVLGLRLRVRAKIRVRVRVRVTVVKWSFGKGASFLPLPLAIPVALTLTTPSPGTLPPAMPSSVYIKAKGIGYFRPRCALNPPPSIHGVYIKAKRETVLSFTLHFSTAVRVRVRAMDFLGM